MQRMVQKVKHLLRAITLLILWVSGFALFYFKKNKTKYGYCVRVITYHQVKDYQVKAFQKNLAFFARTCNVLTPQDFLQKNFSKDKLNILITFDDGYASWITNVLPYMQKYSMKGIYFIPSGFINAGEQGGVFYASKRLSIKKVAPLTWAELRSVFAGETIGGHTVSHPVFASLSKEEIENELQEDKKTIEAVLQKQIDFFAYPFGDSVRVPSWCYDIPAKVGYKFAFTTIPGFANLASEQFSIHRDCLEPDFSPLLTKAWVFGGYDIFRRIKNYLR